MKLLLDTHILIWSAFEPRRISPRVRRLLERQSVERWHWLAEVNATLALNEAPLTHEVVLTAREISIPHNDPADRLIAATARYYGLRLVTADERLLSGSGFPTLAN